MRLWQKTVLLAALLTVFGVYLHYMNPVFKNNDSPETTAAAITLGIGHPPGYPLHALLGKAWSAMMPFGNHAFKINVLAAILAFLCLLVFFRIVYGELSAGVNGFLLSIMLTLILAFSYIFWNQAMEAKGGIYMLHQLFMLVIIMLCIRMIKSFNTKHIYLASFILGLSLANHWPSVLVAVPSFIVVFIIQFKRFTPKRLAVCFAFFILGLTPYLYLVIRANAMASLNWGDPSNLQNLMWVILRKAYLVPVDATAEVFAYQIKEFLGLLAVNFGAFIILSAAGVWFAFKEDRKVSVFLFTMFLSVTAAVVLYNRTQEGVIWLIHIFLMPAFTVLAVFMAYAVKPAMAYSGKSKALQAFFVVLAALFFVHEFMTNVKKNDFGRDYLSYDYGCNLLKNIGHNEAYAGDGDYNLMPVYYITEIQKRRTDVKFATASFLIFKWGIDDFERKFGSGIEMKPYDSEGNIAKIALYYSQKSAFYRSRFLPRLDKFTALNANEYGLLLKLEEKHKVYPALLHDFYVFRNFYETHSVAYKNNRDLLTWYPVSMVNHANALLRAGKPAEALKLYKMSLAFPVEKPLANIYFSMALAYAAMDEKGRELDYLYKSFLAGYKDKVMLESLGIRLYSMMRLKESEQVLKEVINMGGNNPVVKKIIEITGSMSDQDKLETALQRANELMSKQNYKEAYPIYEYLLEKKYKTGIIFLNKGVFYFKTDKTELAIESFKKSLNETKTPEGYIYLGYAYYKKGLKAEAVNVLQQGLMHYPENKQIKELQDKIISN